MKQRKVVIKKERVNKNDSLRIKNCLDHFNSIINTITEYPFDLKEWEEEDFRNCIFKIVDILFDFRDTDNIIME